MINFSHFSDYGKKNKPEVNQIINNQKRWSKPETNQLFKADSISQYSVKQIG